MNQVSVFIRILICACLLMLSSTALAKPVYKWQAVGQSETRKLAGKFFEQKNLPTDATRVLYKTDIDIDGNQVVEAIKTIWYYPKQIDTEEDGNGEVYWDEEVQTLTIREAGVISPDGRYQQIATENVRVVDDDSYNTFTNWKKVILPYSGLAQGDAVILEYERKYPLTRLESNWSHSLYPVTNSDTLDFQLTVKSNSIRLNSSVIGEQIQCQAEDYRLHCIGADLKGYKRDSGVIWRDIIAQVYVSELFEWDAVIEQSLDAFSKAELNSKEADQLFDDITGPASTLDEKITNIQKYVARDIRYISLSELGHRITPHTVASVHKNKFGDCKDKSATAVALLRRLDLDAYPVLVATERKDPTRLITPSSGYFDHMIACFKFDEELYCIDGTDTNTNWRAIPSWIQGRVILPMVKGSEPMKLTVDEPRWELSSNIDLKFEKDASQFEKQVRHYVKSYSGDMRNSLRHLDEKQRLDSLVDQYHDNVSNAVKPEFKFKGIDSLSLNTEIESTVKYDSFLDPESDLDYTERDHWLRYELVNSKLQTENYDSEFDGLSFISIFTLDTSELWRLTRLPASLELEGRFGGMLRHTTMINSSKVSVVTTAVIPRQKVRRADIKAFNEYLDLLASESSINVQGKLLKKT